MRLVGADGYPDKAKYEVELDAAICDFCGSLVASDGRVRPKCTEDEIKAIKQAVNEEAHAGVDWYRLYPPMACHDTKGLCAEPTNESPEGLPGHFHDQFKLLQKHLDAFQETALDRLVRQFLQVTDTEAIHGNPLIPGHARWPPKRAPA